MTHDIGYLGSGLGQAQKCGNVKLVIWIPILHTHMSINEYIGDIQCSLVKPPPSVQSVVWRYNEFGVKLRDIENRKSCDQMKR